MTDSAEVEALHVALLEVGRRFEAGEMTRARRDARLAELSAPGVSRRRKRSRCLRLQAPPPVRFLSIEAARPSAPGRAPAYA